MRKNRWLPVALLGAFFLVNLLFLTAFPAVHSDESWLSGLSRNMWAEGRISVTETFFDAKVRYPHAIKVLFHLLQIGFLLVFGYQLAAFRLMSLLCGTACLALTYLLAVRLTGRRRRGLLVAACLAVDVQFLYAGHFARPEIAILLCMLAVALLLTGRHPRRYLLAGVVGGLSVGVHPNGFLVATMGAALCAAHWLYTGRIRWRGPLLYAGVTGALAGGFALLSLGMDRQFFTHYLAYGTEFEVHASLGSKLLETGPYFQRLFYQVSGTYYTPDIRLQLIGFGLGLLAAAGLVVYKGRNGARSPLVFPLAAVFGIWIGMVLVGRFNQTYVVFFFPFCYLALGGLFAAAGKRLLYGLAAVLAGTVLVRSALEIVPIVRVQRGAYDAYLAEIGSVVPPDGRTIGNLNADYYFENGALLDYRNLGALKEQGISLRQYVEENRVEYLIVSDELYLIHSLRPRWNGIYGNINYLDDLEALLADCTPLHTFRDDLYGGRIAPFLDAGQPFTVSIYRYSPRSP